VSTPLDTPQYNVGPPYCGSNRERGGRDVEAGDANVDGKCRQFGYLYCQCVCLWRVRRLYRLHLCCFLASFSRLPLALAAADPRHAARRLRHHRNRHGLVGHPGEFRPYSADHGSIRREDCHRSRGKFSGGDAALSTKQIRATVS
jgi:hypothetical protein